MDRAQARRPKPDLSFDIGDKIRKARRHAGFSQERLAEIVGVTSQAVGNWESGANSPGDDKIKAIAKATSHRGIGPSVSDLLDSYADYLRAGGCTERTVEARVAGARRLLALAQTEDPAEITATHAVTFIGSVPARSSRATYYAHVRSFARYCSFAGHASAFADNLPIARHPRGVPRPIETTELIRAIAHAADHQAMMLRLAAYAGLRVSEIARAAGEDITPDVIYVCGKGGRVEMIPTHPEIIAAMGDFPVRGWWFPSPGGGPVTRWAVWQQMTKALRSVGSTATPHQVRHWYGTALLESGTDLRTAQTLLRHASLATTQVYTRVTDARRRAAIASLPKVG